MCPHTHNNALKQFVETECCFKMDTLYAARVQPLLCDMQCADDSTLNPAVPRQRVHTVLNQRRNNSVKHLLMDTLAHNCLRAPLDQDETHYIEKVLFLEGLARPTLS